MHLKEMRPDQNYFLKKELLCVVDYYVLESSPFQTQ